VRIWIARYNNNQRMVQATPCPHWQANVDENLQGKMIYKDECARCFLTPVSGYVLISVET
jgi:hypothetical protein